MSDDRIEALGDGVAQILTMLAALERNRGRLEILDRIADGLESLEPVDTMERFEVDTYDALEHMLLTMAAIAGGDLERMHMLERLRHGAE